MIGKWTVTLVPREPRSVVFYEYHFSDDKDTPPVLLSQQDKGYCLAIPAAYTHDSAYFLIGIPPRSLSKALREHKLPPLTEK